MTNTIVIEKRYPAHLTTHPIPLYNSLRKEVTICKTPTPTMVLMK